MPKLKKNKITSSMLPKAKNSTLKAKISTKAAPQKVKAANGSSKSKTASKSTPSLKNNLKKNSKTVSAPVPAKVIEAKSKNLKTKLGKAKELRALKSDSKSPAKLTKTMLSTKSSKSEKTVKPAQRERPKERDTSKPLSAEMLRIRDHLLQMLSSLRKDIDHEFRGASVRDLAHINDTSDMASDSAEGELSLRIAESETVEATEIERAIEKIDNGSYGSCEMCNKVINADRLQFLPFATHCIKCQELAEIRKRDTGDELDDLAEGSDESENN